MKLKYKSVRGEIYHSAVHSINSSLRMVVEYEMRRVVGVSIRPRIFGSTYQIFGSSLSIRLKNEIKI